MKFPFWKLLRLARKAWKGDSKATVDFILLVAEYAAQKTEATQFDDNIVAGLRKLLG